jgi:hypothetical protein
MSMMRGLLCYLTNSSKLGTLWQVPHIEGMTALGYETIRKQSRGAPFIARCVA